jgi:hypothetical protein
MVGSLVGFAVGVAVGRAVGLPVSHDVKNPPFELVGKKSFWNPSIMVGL